VQQIGKALDRRTRSSKHASLAIEDVLRGIVGSIADKWLGINHEPWFPCRS
jgi:hypothetical protein